MIHDILFLLWLFLPGVFANMIPIPVAKISWLKKYNAPLDAGKTFRGKRLLGANKTWRGLVAGMLIATLTFWLQQLAYEHYGWAQSVSGPVDYASLSAFVLGPLIAIGVLGGDAIESFFKRQRGTPPGESWFPWDQLDSVIGAAIVLLPFVAFTPRQFVLIILLGPVIHLVSAYTGYLTGFKDKPI